MVEGLQGQPLVNDTGGGFPQDLYYPNSPKVLAVTLGDQHHRLPYEVLRKGPLLERRMHQRNQRSPVGVVWCLLLCCLTEPLTEILHPHDQWSPLAVQSEMCDRLSNLLSLRDGIFDREGIDLHWYVESQWRDVAVKFQPVRRHTFAFYPGGGGGLTTSLYQ